MRYPSKPESKVTSVFGCRRRQIGANQPMCLWSVVGLERGQAEAGRKLSFEETATATATAIATALGAARSARVDN